MKKNTKQMKLSKLQKQYFGGTLCPDHAGAYDMPEGTYTPCAPTEELPDDAEVECDCCTMRAMRSIGVI